MLESPAPLALSRPFAARYLLGDVLGTGGMGIVHSATQIALGREVAIKIPHASLVDHPFVRERFATEAFVGARLDHPNIARVIDFGDCDGAPYLVMEHVLGTPLDRLVSEQGPLGTVLAVELGGQILAALDATHRAGFAHGDVKTGNVLVADCPDATPHACLIDFGLARRLDVPTSDTRLISGTPDYLAPELVAGGCSTIASDIYAAGVILYELLTGTTPFGGGTSSEILRRQLHDPVVPPSLRCPEQTISRAMESVVIRALDKDPAARFPTAAAFGAALRLTSIAPFVNTLRARGTEPSCFANEASTRDWSSEPQVLASAVPARAAEPIRATVQKAILDDDDDSIVTSYLELVRALIDESQLATAAAELENGIQILRGTARHGTPLATWRLQLCLAALYSGLGDPLRARQAASLGQSDAVRAGSTLGRERADALLARISRHGKRARD